MIGSLTRLAFGALVLIWVAGPISSLWAGEPQSLPLTPLTIERADGSSHSFQVEVAVTPRERAIGLMYREYLAADRGMLFDFGASGFRSFWMKNTYVSLDMLFIDADGVIFQIETETTPLSLEPITSNAPARAVLELQGGLAAFLGIMPGDRVIHERLVNPE